MVEQLEKKVECECGWTCRGTDDQIVEAVQRHVHEVHDMEVTRDQVLASAEPVDDSR